MSKICQADTEDLLEKAFKIRREVFVVEQQVATEEEFDEFEPTSRHFVALSDDGDPVGAARWRKTQNGVKLERFAVKSSARRQGIGASLVKVVLDDIIRQEGAGVYLYLHAQLPAVPLYQKFGFEVEGDQFLECNIWHYLMHRRS